MGPPVKRIDFLEGDYVEICSKEGGFEVSYYEAEVLSHLDNGLCVVEHINLLNDEENYRFLTEKVCPKDLRPLPPKVPTTEFSLDQKVDAFENEGWWVGKITGRRDANKYFVCSETSQSHQECVFHYSELRVHHDWVHGQWVLS